MLKLNRHDITEILLKVALNIITTTLIIVLIILKINARENRWVNQVLIFQR